ncbi:hypothetical protein KCV05_g238, partial [Aureobasidium melanogenum]
MQAANLASCRSDDFLEQECPEMGEAYVVRNSIISLVVKVLSCNPLQKQRVLVGLRGVVDESVRGSLHSGSSQNHFWRPLKVARPAQGEHLRWSIDAGTLEFHDEDVKKETKQRPNPSYLLWVWQLGSRQGSACDRCGSGDSQQAARLCIGQIFCNPVLLVSQLGQLRRLWLAVLLAAPVAVADLTELRLNDQHGARFCQTTVGLSYWDSLQESRGDADVDRPLDSWHLEDDEALATPSLPTTVTLN